jgi:DNA polymerase-3 subunit alpha
MVAVINNFGGFYSTELYFIELYKTGTPIELPCANCSDEFTNIVDDKVYVGFTHIKDLQKKLVIQVLEERLANGHYQSLENFIERIRIGIKQLELLIYVGAFRFTGKSKKQLLWEAHTLLKNKSARSNAVIPLFNEPVKQFNLPDLTDHPLDDIYYQVEHLKFALGNPFDLADADPSHYVAAKDLHKFAGKIVTVLGYFITHKDVPTKQGDYMYFGTFLDPNLDWLDTVHFPQSAKEYPIEKDGFYKATGKVTMDFGVVSLEVRKIERVEYRERSYAGLN